MCSSVFGMWRICRTIPFSDAMVYLAPCCGMTEKLWNTPFCNVLHIILRAKGRQRVLEICQPCKGPETTQKRRRRLAADDSWSMYSQLVTVCWPFDRFLKCDRCCHSLNRNQVAFTPKNVCCTKYVENTRSFLDTSLWMHTCETFNTTVKLPSARIDKRHFNAWDESSRETYQRFRSADPVPGIFPDQPVLPLAN